MGLSSRPRSEGLFGSRNTTGPRFSFGSSMPRNQSQRSFFFKSSNVQITVQMTVQVLLLGMKVIKKSKKLEKL